MNILSQTVPLQYDTVFSPYAAKDWKSAFEDLRRKGFTGAEIAVAYPERIDADELNREAGKNGLAITTISTGQIFGLEGLFLASADREVRERAMDVVRGHIALSVKIGRPRVTIGLLRGKPDQPLETSLRLLGEAMPPLVELAEKSDVMLQIEPINRSETTFLHTTREAMRFLHALGDPGRVGILYDTYHSNLEDGDMEEAIREAGARITNVHIADSHRGLPGEGTIDFPGVVAAILNTGYRGPFALETLCVPSREHTLAHDGEALHAVMRRAQETVQKTK